MADIDFNKTPGGKKGQALVQAWMSEICEAQKREAEWRKEARTVTDLYEAEGASAEDSFNILYSNTETLAPALFNSPPRPRVRRRFLDEDPIGRQAAKTVERTLSFLLDSSNRDYPEFESLVEEAVLGALVPGRGVTRFKYEAEFASEEVEGEDGELQTQEVLRTESVCGETVPWNRFLHGYAKKWKNVPWVAFEWPMTESELERNFGRKAAKGELVELERENDGQDMDEGSRKTNTSTSGAWVYEIWDKETRKVFFISPSFPDWPLREVADPLGLSGFFPCPEPLRFTRRLDSLIPIPIYKFYEAQAKELNRVSTRINKLITALKHRGFYDSSLEGLEKLMTAADNTLLPAENVAALQTTGGLDKAIYLMPLEKLIAVLQQLYTQRQQTKQVIYEITGIADIMRGASAASETLGAQQIKNQWGTLRLKHSQRKVQLYVRDCLRIEAEIAVTKFSPDTIAAMTGSSLPRQTQKEQAQMMMQAQAQQAQLTGQQPPQPDPAMMQALAMPSLEEVLQILQNDLLRAYKIDIETNSTIEEEVAEDKADIAEMMNALGQFLNGVAPLVMQGVLPFEIAKGLLMGITRRFRFGGDVEELLEKMQPPSGAPVGEEDEAPAGDSPEVAQAKAQADLAAESSRQQTIQLEMEASRAEHQMKMEELRLKHELLQAQHQAKMAQAAAAMAKARQQPAGIPASKPRS